MLISQYSRISHHTLTTTGSTLFTIPPTEDFTTGAWSTTDLALSEFGVKEGTGQAFLRIGGTIYQLMLTTSTGATTDVFVDAGTFSGDTINFTYNVGGGFAVTGITAGGGNGYTLLDTFDFNIINANSGVTEFVLDVYALPADTFIEHVLLKTVTPLDVDNFDALVTDTVPLSQAFATVYTAAAGGINVKPVSSTQSQFTNFDIIISSNTFAPFANTNTTGSFEVYIKYGTI